MKVLGGCALFLPVTFAGLVIAILIAAIVHGEASPLPQSQQNLFIMLFGAFQWLYLVPLALWLSRRKQPQVVIGLLIGGAGMTALSGIALFAFLLTR